MAEPAPPVAQPGPLSTDAVRIMAMTKATPLAEKAILQLCDRLDAATALLSRLELWMDATWENAELNAVLAEVRAFLGGQEQGADAALERQLSQIRNSERQAHRDAHETLIGGQEP